MASVWLQNGRKEPIKLVGHLPADTSSKGVLARFKIEVSKACKRFDAEVTYQDDMNALLQPKSPDGDTLILYRPIAMWIEAASPPTAPETGQPKLYKGKGVVITSDGDAVALTHPRDIKP